MVDRTGDSAVGIPGKDPALSAIHVSIDFDRRLWREDLDGSRAHVRMLGERGVLAPEEVQTILAGLDRVAAEIEAGTFPWREAYEDVHLNIERRLTELVGPVGGKLHTGRSRNDQVATDLRLWTVRRLAELDREVAALGTQLLAQAHAAFERRTVLPFYTHLQRAQPVLLAHHLLAHLEALGRDRERLAAARERAAECPLGAGAGAGSGFPVDPARSAELLGFRRACRNSLDAVSARDFALETLAALSILMVHLSRLAEELILWSSQEFGFVTLGDAVTTGSSIMPQKRNPDGAELVRGKTGRVFGALQALLVANKALPLAYNKDLQEDKEALFDAVDTARLSLRVLTASLREAHFHDERMREAAEARAGYANATELADYLAARGMPFREAHAAVRALVEQARAEGKRLQDLGLERLRAISPVVDDDVLACLETEAALARRAAPMGTAPERVREALAEARARWSDGD
ncbi:MAG: argininosuccinate lyase [Planctomycetota bacterium]|nr:MAG: argininosuccinate lyase [Planctomycetota bacterium]